MPFSASRELHLCGISIILLILMSPVRGRQSALPVLSKVLGVLPLLPPHPRESPGGVINVIDAVLSC